MYTKGIREVCFCAGFAAIYVGMNKTTWPGVTSEFYTIFQVHIISNHHRIRIQKRFVLIQFCGPKKAADISTA